jgi:hypothetical protein
VKLGIQRPQVIQKRCLKHQRKIEKNNK